MGLITVVEIGIGSHQKPMVYLRSDCEVCMAEGFSASTWVALEFKDRTLIATKFNDLIRCFYSMESFRLC